SNSQTMKISKILITVLILFVSTSFIPVKESYRQGMDIAINGKARAVIVKPSEATLRENLAAEELQKYIRQISGALLAIKTDKDNVGGNLLLIGGPERNKKTAELISQVKFDAEVPGPEGMMIKTFGENKLVLAGSSKNPREYERGTLYAVYEFLETYLGCSFVAYGKPGKGIGEYIPSQKTISVSSIDKVQSKADIPYRTAIINHYQEVSTDHGLVAPFIDWMIKNKYNRILAMASVYEAYKANGMLEEARKRGIAFTVGNHESTTLFLPMNGNAYFPEHYYETHPEYYKLQDDGTRYFSTTHWGGQWILDSRNRGAIEEVAKNITIWLTRNPYVDIVSLWPNDGVGEQCICKDCAPYSKTANYAYFVNEVAKVVSKDHPSAKIDMLTYVDIWPYPGIQLHPSVQVDQASWNSKGVRRNGKNDGSSLIGTPYINNAKNWAANGAKLVHYEYYMGRFAWDHLYFPMADELDDIYLHMKNNGYALGAGTQIECYNMWNLLFNFYMFGRTSYNSSLKLKDNLQTFSKIFGAGAPHIRSYIEYAESVYEGQGSDQKGDEQPGKWFAKNVNKETVYKFFEDAFDAEPEGRLRDNIRMLRMAFRYTDLYVNGGGDGEMKYMRDHFDSYYSKLGYGISIKKEGSGMFTPDKWYKLSSGL
ncbi:MAG: DUF4838 domain-containing protein, partial [Ferruginibacter sp.]